MSDFMEIPFHTSASANPYPFYLQAMPPVKYHSQTSFSGLNITTGTSFYMGMGDPWVSIPAEYQCPACEGEGSYSGYNESGNWFSGSCPVCNGQGVPPIPAGEFE